MKCVICHGQDVRASEVDEELKLEDDVVRVPVRVLLCMTCGERYFDRRTMRYLEEVEGKIRSGRLTLKDVGKVRVYSPSRD